MSSYLFIQYLISSIKKQYDEDALTKPKRGPKYKFSTKQELELLAYTQYCWERNFPKTEAMLTTEIPYYLELENAENRFKGGKPGMLVSKECN